MIYVNPLGQFGNQLVEFCVGRILSERTGQAFDFGPWLNKAGQPLKWTGKPFFEPTPSPGERDGVGDYSIDCQHWFNIDAVPKGWNIHATGFFQRWEILKPWKDKIRNDWLKIRVPFVETDPGAVHIHVRRTDYLGDDLHPDRNCQATTMEEYAACLKRFPDVKRIEIVTDDYSDPFHARFVELGLPFSYHVGPRTWDQDFLTLASCKNLIMSQSTFSFWAAFLGQAERIVCPVFPNTFWGRGVGLIGPPKGPWDYPNLYVDDEPGRWEWITE